MASLRFWASVSISTIAIRAPTTLFKGLHLKSIFSMVHFASPGTNNIPSESLMTKPQRTLLVSVSTAPSQLIFRKPSVGLSHFLGIVSFCVFCSKHLLRTPLCSSASDSRYQRWTLQPHAVLHPRIEIRSSMFSRLNHLLGWCLSSEMLLRLHCMDIFIYEWVSQSSLATC